MHVDDFCLPETRAADLAKWQDWLQPSVAILGMCKCQWAYFHTGLQPPCHLTSVPLTEEPGL